MTNNYSEKDFLKVFEKERKKIESKLNGLFKNNKPDSLYAPCRYGIAGGGKRLRPMLVLLSANSVGGEFRNCYNAAISVELLHNFTLVHDDIMDNSSKRRGKPSLHVKYDTNTAILAGDNLIGLAYEFLLKDTLDTNSKEVTSIFTRGMIEVCEGQSYDKDFELREQITIKEYMMMIGKKTAALAEMCCRIGAIIGGGTPEQVKGLANYGKNLGIAFQIQDDLLDIYADEEEFGKPIGGDLIEGKKTYLFLKALEKADGSYKEDLLKVVKNKGIKKNQVSKYKSIYSELGVLEDAKNEIVRYTRKGLKSLSVLDNENSIKLLDWLANSLIKRSK